jgi:hypothetical protein
VFGWRNDALGVVGESVKFDREFRVNGDEREVDTTRLARVFYDVVLGCDVKNSRLA